MKCDHLIGRTFDGDVYILASDVMEAVAELKEFAGDACLERDDNQTAIDELQYENASLKAKLDKAIAERDGNQVCIDALKAKLENVQASMYCDVVDANMEVRRLKRALYNLRAAYADMMQKRYIECKTDGWVHRVDKWIEVERRCLKKAEEYK